MAPQRDVAIANVLSCSAVTHDQSSVLVEPGGYAPMRWFLQHALKPQSGDDDGDGPPKKKRKTEVVKSLQSTTIDPGKHIPVSSVALYLHFPTSLKERAVDEREVVEDVRFEGRPSITVMPSIIDMFEAGTKIRLSLSETKKSDVLVMDCASIPTPVVDAFRELAMSRLRQSWAVQPNNEDSGASFCRCTLTESSGRKYAVARLEATVYWNSGACAFPASVPVGKPRIYHDYNLLAKTFPDERRDESDQPYRWAPQDFYDSVHVPEKIRNTKKDFDGVLESDLYPFQKRAVHWMLEREGVVYDRGDFHPLQKAWRMRGVELYHPYKDLGGNECFVNHLEGIVRRKQPENDPCHLSGGILAEEMGLGKTVELLALLSVHRRPEISLQTYFNPEFNLDITPSKATLIITPNTILQQWKAELSQHAPGLKVFHYEGITSKTAKSQRELTDDMATKYDVVLATYTTLAREVHFAEEPPDRDMRHARRFERKRSPLVQIQWWRICLDEAQMVESGVTAAARVARRLERVHSWAVSGTPLRKNEQDLHGLLIFLGYQPFSDNRKLWGHLMTNHRHIFRSIFGLIAMRHTKAQIREELQLPQQKRVVITTPFTTVELQNYSKLFGEMCDAVGVQSDGSPKNDDWDPNDSLTVESMRNWLVQLRQSCLHPQVGSRNRRALGRGRGPLRTVQEVLEVMIENNENKIRAAERELLNGKLLRGHIIGNNRGEDRRSLHALAIYDEAMQRSGQLVDEARAKLAAAKKEEAESGEGNAESDGESSSSESTAKVGRLKNNLKSALQLQHTCTFFAATACFQAKTNIDITEPETEIFTMREEQETMLYERAKTIRKEVLADCTRKSESLMGRIRNFVDQNVFTTMPRLKDLQSLGGIESRRIVEKSDDLFDKIREQGSVISKWRLKMADYLLKPLVDKDDGLEITGDEYEDSTKLQDELYVYFDAVKALWWDLNTFITGEKAPLIDVEVKTNVKAAQTFLDPDVPDEIKPQVHAPELALEMYATRNRLRGDKNDFHSVRGLIAEARALEGVSQGGGGSIRAAEGALLHQHLEALQAIFNSYNKALGALEKEIELFRSTQNSRLEFYRQLQEVSDAVQPWREELDLELDMEALNNATAKEEQSTRALNKMKSERTYLYSLGNEMAASDRTCFICTGTFLSGVLTVCGHMACRDCMMEWLKSKPTAMKTCPACRRPLTMADMNNITFNPMKLKAREEVPSGSSSAELTTHQTAHTAIYSDIEPSILQQIQSIDLPTSYSTKIDTLGRHLNWIREHDPGAKAIVFSQFREFLDMLGTALQDFRIGYVRLGRGGAVEKFKKDPSVDCLLLDAKTDSSGMTLVNATHVFLCEPLIQTAVELQAIARVHRIGQTRPTTVWQYYVNDTVEEAIYDISVDRRLKHVQARQSNRAQKSRSATPAPLQESAIDAANSAALETNPLSNLLVAGKGGGEVVKKDDLWQCLFGKTQQNASVTNVEDVPLMVRHLRAEAAEARQVEAMDASEG